MDFLEFGNVLNENFLSSLLFQVQCEHPFHRIIDNHSKFQIRTMQVNMGRLDQVFRYLAIHNGVSLQIIFHLVHPRYIPAVLAA